MSHIPTGDPGLVADSSGRIRMPSTASYVNPAIVTSAPVAQNPPLGRTPTASLVPEFNPMRRTTTIAEQVTSLLTGVNLPRADTLQTIQDDTSSIYSDSETELLDIEEHKDEADSKKGESPSVPLSLLKTDPDMGLDEDEVLLRQRKYGKNMLPEEKVNNLKKFFGYFTGPIEILIELAAILSAGLQRWIDLGVIAALLILNATVGFLQEYQAGNVVESLKSKLALQTRVIRNGQVQTVEAKELVPGDIILVGEGDVIPADARILGDMNTMIQVDQSALTGESLAVTKHYDEVLYSSSAVKRGSVKAIVEATGSATFVGRAAVLSAGATDTGHFTKVLNKIATFLIFTDVFFVFIIIASTLYRGQPITDMLLLIMILTVVAVPIALPAVVTTTLAVGASILAEKSAIVKRLTAIESLAGVDILCSDKTGTLTKNRLTIMNDPFLLPGYQIFEVMTAAACASSFEKPEAIDKTIKKSLKTYRIARAERPKYHVVEFNPFDPVSKRVLAVCEKDGKTFKFCKGAPQIVMKLANEDGHIHEAAVKTYNHEVEDMARRGQRALGVARKIDDQPWELLGLLSFSDPPRVDSARTIAEANSLGVDVKMLTGDALAIARETARRLGMGDNILDSTRLMGTPSAGSASAAIDASCGDLIEGANGFAQVFPEHKYQVVDVLQHRKHLVAMTGDGVNDAPALKKSDCGIAVQGSTEAAKSAAALLLLAPGLSVIVDAIRTSRQIFHRMHGYAVYRIAVSFHLLIYITFAILTMNFFLNSTLIVFIAIFSDIAVLTIAYDRAPFARQPVSWNIPRLIGLSFVLSLILMAATFIAHTATLTHPTFTSATDSVVFLEIVLTQNLMIFTTRTDGPFYTYLPSWQLLGAVLFVDIMASLFCLFGWFTQKISIVLVVRIWIYSVVVFALGDIVHRSLANSEFFNRLCHFQLRSSYRDRERMRRLEDEIAYLQKVTIDHERAWRHANEVNGSTSTAASTASKGDEDIDSLKVQLSK